MTPRELFREFAAANARRRDDANRDARLAWIMIDMWVHVRTKHRMPDLRKYLVTNERGGPSSHGAIRAALSVMSEQYNIPLRSGKKRKAS